LESGESEVASSVGCRKLHDVSRAEVHCGPLSNLVFQREEDDLLVSAEFVEDVECPLGAVGVALHGYIVEKEGA